MDKRTFTTRRRPLIITADPELLDDLLRLTAEAGLIADAAADPAATRAFYADAPMVFVGTDKAQACVRAGLPVRPNVVLVERREHDQPDFGQAEALGADHIITLPAGEPWLLERLVSFDDDDAGSVIAVIGGRGGAGASVLAGGLAITAARFGMRTLLVDADPLGGGADLVLGWESLGGLRWPDLSAASGRVPAPAFVESLPGRTDLVVLSWDRGEPTVVPTEAMMSALDASKRGRDLVVVDVPRYLDEPSLIALRAAHRAYMVVPAELRACAAAARVAANVLPHAPSLSIVVRQPGPAGLTVNEVVDAVHLPLAGTLRSEATLAKDLERGVAPASSGRGSLAVLCEKLLGSLVEAEQDAA